MTDLALPEPGTIVKVVRAYDRRLVGLTLTVRRSARSYTESVRRDGYIVVQAPELDALQVRDRTDYSLGAYCEVRPITEETPT